MMRSAAPEGVSDFLCMRSTLCRLREYMVDADLLDHLVSKVDGDVALTGGGLLPELVKAGIWGPGHQVPETIAATWSQTTVQTCTSHLIRPPVELVEGATIQDWQKALDSLTMAFPERITHYIKENPNFRSLTQKT